jgi:hypothetical protein
MLVCNGLSTDLQWKSGVQGTWTRSQKVNLDSVPRTWCPVPIQARFLRRLGSLAQVWEGRGQT